MDLEILATSTVSKSGQATIPSKVRKLIKLETGDLLVFYQKKDGEIVIRSSKNI